MNCCSTSKRSCANRFTPARGLQRSAGGRQRHGLPSDGHCGSERRQKRATEARFSEVACIAAAAQGNAELTRMAAVAIGWIVIAGSCLRSVPQIVRIVKAKSVEGISLTATVVETLCYTVIVGYSLFHQYVFSSYGDVFACWIQNILLCAMLAWYRKAPLRVWLPSAVAFGAYNWWVISGACGEQMLLLGQISVGFAMSLGARVPQIVLNYRRGNSGELSLITCALSSLGNLARCFTTVILTADWVLFASTFAQFVLNGILTWQCVDTERQNRAAASAADGETKAA